MVKSISFTLCLGQKNVYCEDSYLGFKATQFISSLVTFRNATATKQRLNDGLTTLQDFTRLVIIIQLSMHNLF